MLFSFILRSVYVFLYFLSNLGTQHLGEVSNQTVFKLLINVKPVRFPLRKNRAGFFFFFFLHVMKASIALTGLNQ